MSKCSSGCSTQNHRSYGECLRSKTVATTGLETNGQGFARSTQKAWDRENAAYASAVKQGIQPASTNLRDINRAVEASNRAGAPYRADQ